MGRGLCRELKCRPVSDLVESAAAALGIPSALAQRSAAARAAETGASVDDVLTAWAGGAPAPSAAPAETAPAPAAEPAMAATEEEPAAAVAVMEAPIVEAPVVEEIVYEEEPPEPVEPVPLGRRLRTAVRVGAWSGAGLGLIGFMVASAFWSDSTAVLSDTGPIVQVDPTGVMIGAALVSLVFGGVVAGLSRAAAASADPGAQLSSSRASTAWIGAAIGLILGVIAGALLTSFGTEVVAGEETLTQLPVLATLAVMVIGGGILGAMTAFIPQFFGTPVALDEADEEEVTQVRNRLGNAVSIPMAGAILLLLLVLPFAYILIESNHLMENGAALVAVLVASGVLGFAALAGSKPEMKISFGDVMVAVAGIGTILVIIVAVLLFNAPEEHGSEEGGEPASVTGPGGTIEITATSEFSFDASEWATEQGEVTFVLENQGNTSHSLVIEGLESEMKLQVSRDGDVDSGAIPLSNGSYTIYCDIKGHRELGMEGTLTVQAPGP